MVANMATLAMLTVAVALGTSSAGSGIPTFASLDANGDGHLSDTEAAARHGLRELISDYDRNGDGGLDPEEYRALLEDAAREVRRMETASGPTR